MGLYLRAGVAVCLDACMYMFSYTTRDHARHR